MMIWTPSRSQCKHAQAGYSEVTHKDTFVFGSTVSNQQFICSFITEPQYFFLQSGIKVVHTDLSCWAFMFHGFLEIDFVGATSV